MTWQRAHDLDDQERHDWYNERPPRTREDNPLSPTLEDETDQ
jgi:hypothetical protein